MTKAPGNSDIKLQDGDNINLKKFFYDFFPVFASFAGKYIPDKMVCEDIVQNVFISFWEEQKTFKNLIAVKGFFYISIRNLCLDYLKHIKVEEKYRSYLTLLDAGYESFLDGVLKVEAHSLVYDEINKLPKMSKSVLLLALREKSNEEIATSLNIAVNTVKTHKSRAYKILRKNLKEIFFLILPAKYCSV